MKQAVKTSGIKDTYSSEAWLMSGLIDSLPGVLTLENSRLKFTALGSGTLWMSSLRKLENKTGIVGLAEKLDADEAIQIFDVALSDVQSIVFPFIYFSAGAHIKINDQNYRLSFIQPNNTKMPVLDRSDIKEVLEKSVESIRDIFHSRKVGKKWKSLLLS